MNNDLINRIVTNVIPDKKGLLKKLASGNSRLNVYLGIDPTATKIHLGHAVPLRALNAFAQAGHNVTFLIGDFTALIGDSSDKTSERPILTVEEINKNFATYKRQAEKLVDFSKVNVKFNSYWLKKLNFEEIIKLSQNFSVGDFISRELIRDRLDNGARVRLDEVLYPVMQGYDSYFMNTDVQIGGADQTFNMQAGRTLQKNLRNKNSYVLVTGYLEGTDGRKMSKSWGNAIWLTDEPEDMFGKVMSLRDELIEQYFKMATNLPEEKINESISRLKKGENPINIKSDLAYEIVSELHGSKNAQRARIHFEKTFQMGTPSFNKMVKDVETLIDAVTKAAGVSNSQAKRLITNSAVQINGESVTDTKGSVKRGDQLKIGKKIFVTVE